jgi:hypothetical protein
MCPIPFVSLSLSLFFFHVLTHVSLDYGLRLTEEEGSALSPLRVLSLSRCPLYLHTHTCSPFSVLLNMLFSIGELSASKKREVAKKEGGIAPLYFFP